MLTAVLGHGSGASLLAGSSSGSSLGCSPHPPWIILRPPRSLSILPRCLCSILFPVHPHPCAAPASKQWLKNSNPSLDAISTGMMHCPDPPGLAAGFLSRSQMLVAPLTPSWPPFGAGATGLWGSQAAAITGRWEGPGDAKLRIRIFLPTIPT